MSEEIINIKKLLIEKWALTRDIRHNLHVSYLLHCRRRIANEILNGPEPLKERTFRSFLLGSAIHRELQEILGDEFETEKEITHTFLSSNGKEITIKGHADAVHKSKTGEITVVEIKTTSNVLVKDIEGVYPYHLKQLRFYQSLLGASRGILLYVIMGTAYLSNYMPQYNLTMTEQELKRTLRHMEMDAAELQEAIDNKSPDSVQVWDIIKNDNYLTVDGSNWFCETCPLSKSKKCEEYELFKQGKISDEDIINNILPKVKQLF